VSDIPAELHYTAEHEWVLRTGADTVRVGITDFAQDALGDVVFVQLPDVGTEVTAGEAFGEVESTKSVSDLFAPLTATVAAVNGAAVGAGMNLALACDVRLAARSARFEDRFLDLGIHPGGGHTWMMRRITGPQTTAAAVLFGEVLDGAAAERVGLAWRCVDDDELLDAAVALADRAAGAPAALVRRTKATIADMATIDDHAHAVRRELIDQLWSMDQPAFAERLAALQRRITGD
jgi:enoyl-CoA hydratase/carnithine racemase